MTKAQTEVVGGVSKGDLDIWKDVSGHLSPGGYVDYILPSRERSQPLTITLSGIEQEDGVDLFVTPKSSRQRVLPRDSAHVFGDFSPPRMESNLSPCHLRMWKWKGQEQLALFMGFPLKTSERASQSIAVRANGGSPTSKAGQDRLEVDGEEHSSDEEQCSNSKQWDPKTYNGSTRELLPEEQRPMPLLLCRLQKKTQTSGVDANTTRQEGNSAASKSKHDMIFHQHHPFRGCQVTTNSLADLARHQTSVCPGELHPMSGSATSKFRKRATPSTLHQKLSYPVSRRTNSLMVPILH